MRKSLAIPAIGSAVLFVGAFGLLATRAVRTIEVEAKSAVEGRLRADAERAAARAERRLAELLEPRFGAADAWRVDTRGRFLAPPEPEPFDTPALPPEMAERRRLLLREAERLELVEGDLETAAGYYYAVAGGGAPKAVRRIALSRLAAVETRRGHADAALAAWRRVVPIAGDTELIFRAAAAGAEVPEADLVAAAVRHLGAGPPGVVEGYCRLAGIADRPEIGARAADVVWMRAIRPRLLPPPAAGEVRAIPLRDGGAAFLREGRVAALTAAEMAVVLGPAPVADDGAPRVEVAGTGPLAGFRFAASAAPGEIESAVRRQSAVLLGAVGLAAAAGLAALVLLFRAVRKEVELASLKSEFVANVSHELRTPLSLVRIYAETLRNGRVPDGETDDYVAVIDREAAALARLVDRVLDFARIERGTKEYRREAGDLAALVREVGASAPARHRDLELAVEAPVGPVSARFDREAIAGAIGNLLDNADRHAGGKGVVLALAGTENGEVRIEVRDRGPGVPAAEAGRIFDRFHRGRAAVRDAVRGSGLGLTLVRHAARGHGGDAGVRPRDGGGSVFFMELR